METTQLKNYGPRARRAFMEAVKNRAAVYGLLPKEILPLREDGDVVIIGDRPFPRSVAVQRKELEAKIHAVGFQQFIEAIAYTWFNRFVAIRYMELHGYLDHGYRVLSGRKVSSGQSAVGSGKKVGGGRKVGSGQSTVSSEEGNSAHRPLTTGHSSPPAHRTLATAHSLPEILEHATEVDLPGLDREKVVELKLDGTQDEELYRRLLLAQCNALHQAMPFLFEKIGDGTELLLPTNLLHTDSLIRELVEQIDEPLWQEIEIIGWLYQFYISEKKDQVIGKVVKSEDIPAATQLFTPNWIVKYMVQNSLGAQWLATYPDSPLKGQMEYYIEPAEQTEEVNAQLAAITPSQLDPEALTLIDPACGSGHILVEAYELFKSIYLERGYRLRDVPQLILEKNLFGLDIDPRAAQLSGFALMMKGRADDRRLFDRGVRLNVMALVDSTGLDAEDVYSALLAVQAESLQVDPPAPDGQLFETEDNLSTRVIAEPAQSPLSTGYSQDDVADLIKLFEHATTFGSLIPVPAGLVAKLPLLKQLSQVTSQDLFVAESLKQLRPMVQQAKILAAKYDAVVANPPYMGSKGMNSKLKKFVSDRFPDARKDLFACFVERGYTLADDDGHNAMVTMQTWMFLSSFETMRGQLLREKTIRTMAHLGARAFGSISGEVVQTTACVLRNRAVESYRPTFFRLLDGGEEEKRSALVAGDCRFDATAQNEFKTIPGSPVAYWVGGRTREAFSSNLGLGAVFPVRDGMTTGNNDRFLRRWHEVNHQSVGLGKGTPTLAAASGQRWFPCNKGGPFRRWYGNNEFLILWDNDGKEIKEDKLARLAQGLCLPSNSKPKNQQFYFRESATWTDISSSFLAVRWSPAGSISETTGPAVYAGETSQAVLAFLCTSIAASLVRVVNPTLHCKPGNIAVLPWNKDVPVDYVDRQARTLIDLAKTDWDAYERSWDFQSLPLLTFSSDPTATLKSSCTVWGTLNRETIAEMQRLEEENNQLFIDAYGLQDELTPEVPIEQITLTVNPAYRYGKKLESSEWSVDIGFGEELETKFREDTMQELISYAIGCIMGRYSLDSPGLIYAQSGNQEFDPSRYTNFPADDDGIVPLTDTQWFDDDAAQRVEEFVEVAWDKGHLETNLKFLADNLTPKRGESSRETIRRYLCDKFFKDHLQTYKKRPIYWLFSSGKQKAFQCLVYLHRYHEGTLARMRTKYVVPLQGQINFRIDQLSGDIPAAGSTSHRKRLETERNKLVKQREELRDFDDKLRHYADQLIPLDLDDGVKVNYGKFGDLLAEVKAICRKEVESGQ